MVSQRHDQVVISLSQRRAVPGIAFLTFPVRLDNRPVSSGVALFHPGEERWAEIKAHAGVITHDAADIAFAVKDTRSGIGQVALGGDPFIPVVVRVSRVLLLDVFQPGIFAGRLVKVPVNTDITVHLKSGDPAFSARLFSLEYHELPSYGKTPPDYIGLCPAKRGIYLRCPARSATAFPAKGPRGLPE